MSKTAVVVIGLVGTFFLLGAISVFSVIGIHDNMVRHEEIIKAQYEQNKNNYSNMFAKFKEVASVPEMYTEDLQKLYGEAMTARYGKEGSKAMFQWLQEHNPNLDASMYTKIQVVVEAGRNDFEHNQKLLIDKKQVYQGELRTALTGSVARFMGFPKIDLDKLGIVTNQETEQAFETKKAGPIKLR